MVIPWLTGALGVPVATAPGVDVGSVELQSQLQFQVQLHLHGFDQPQLKVRPSESFHVQLQVHVPSCVAPAGVDAFDGCDAAPTSFVQTQFQTAAAVGAVPSAVAPAGGAQSPFQFQFQTHDPLEGAPEAEPGRTIATFVLEPPVTFTTLRSGLVPVAVALPIWLTAPSLPGLAMRTETFMFVESICVAFAEPMVIPGEVVAVCADADAATGGAALLFAWSID